MSFGERLRQIRREQFVRQKQLADHLNVAVSTLSQYENDKRHPNFDILVDIAHYFNVSTDYLLGLSNKQGSFESTIENIDTTLESCSYSRLMSKITDNLKSISDIHDERYLEILYRLYDSVASIGLDDQHKIISGNTEEMLSNHQSQKESIDQTLNTLFRHHLKNYREH